MRSSSLNRKVIFKKKVESTDTHGAPINDEYVDIVNPDAWVQIIPLKGDEKYASKHLNTEVDHKVRMRYRNDIDSTMIIMYGFRKFEIDSVVNPFERNKELQLLCTEVFRD